jgi:hypothetical protein
MKYLIYHVKSTFPETRKAANKFRRIIQNFMSKIFYPYSNREKKQPLIWYHEGFQKIIKLEVVRIQI